MTFSDDVRAELAAIAPARGCCRLAELSGLARSAGTVHLHGRDSVTLHLDLASPAVARRAFTLARGFGVGLEVRAYRRHAFGRETRFELHVPDDPRALQTLNEAGVLDVHLAPLPEPPRRVVARPCCRAAYLRGALLAAGSVTGPRAPHLELRTQTREGAAFAARLAGEEGLELGVAARPRHTVVYARGGETIAGLLAFVGAHAAALALGERAVVGATRAHANRLANADHANLVRLTRSAQAQVRAVRRLSRLGTLDHLPADLQQIAALRLEHPTLSLRELGQRSRPALPKATVARRLKRIERLAGG